jgi:hypothetical protein
VTQAQFKENVMSKRAVRADARTLPKATKRSKSKTSRVPTHARGVRITALQRIGKRLEQLTREREAADRLRGRARLRFEKIAPKLTPMEGLPETSIAKVWNILIDPQDYQRKYSVFQRWLTMQRLFSPREGIAFTTIKAAAKKSGYATAAERVKSIDMEIHDLASRALKVQAANLAGAGCQALAVLALDKTEYGRQGLGPRFPHEGVLLLSRAVVGLSNAQEALR